MHSSIDNELDVESCVQRLWRGKKWIGLGLILGVLLAWTYTMFATQKWVAVAQFSRPDLSKVTRYYQELSKLNQLSTSSDPASTADTADVDTVLDAVYQTFLQQLASVDNRRRFWLEQGRADKAESMTPTRLDRRVASIQFAAGDKLHGTVDTLSLTAESAASSSQLLKRYLAFTDQQVMAQVQQQLLAAWQSEMTKITQQLAFEKSVAQAAYDQQVKQLKNEAAQSDDNQTKAAINVIEQTGPVASDSLLRDQARLAALQSGPTSLKPFTSWTMLQSPEPPISRQSPRLPLLMVMWGLVGIIIGAGFALTQRVKKKE
ncbi:Wzz/FepE/Etk N-terminal domain-containing protein [Rosenbergiella nectarea]|uniref:Wzz/FepE/Etk N-terminal domain-containing protein n=1 Tax=Rosenbergiella nectarea TaxID=988801 RepID=UPI001BDAE051|nr:Wzz/FepE/Etk N-terminal domain-containing protein [Rosenbergiella nectarea]MBT0730556.1 hypothetical protein [Rosenbergiella nectarea subsp. apis]